MREIGRSRTCLSPVRHLMSMGMPSTLRDASSPSFTSTFPSGDALMAEFRKVVSAAGGTESIAGSSVEGRPLVRFDLGTPGRPVVLMTALMHGVEVIGSLALLDLLEKLGDDRLPGMARLRSEAHVVVLPVVNPDALAANMTKVAKGERAWQRCNANGVDL